MNDKTSTIAIGGYIEDKRYQMGKKPVISNVYASCIQLTNFLQKMKNTTSNTKYTHRHVVCNLKKKETVSLTSSCLSLGKTELLSLSTMCCALLALFVEGPFLPILRSFIFHSGNKPPVLSGAGFTKHVAFSLTRSTILEM